MSLLPRKPKRQSFPAFFAAAVSQAPPAISCEEEWTEYRQFFTRLQEGRQAVMASDFAMGQFRFLVPLLLVHGHWYQRMGYMVLYNFYRNATFVFVLFWAIYKVMGTGLFWALLLTVIVVETIPHFAAKFTREHLIPSDIQNAREMEKSQDSHAATYPEVQMSTMARA